MASTGTSLRKTSVEKMKMLCFRLTNHKFQATALLLREKSLTLLFVFYRHVEIPLFLFDNDQAMVVTIMEHRLLRMATTSMDAPHLCLPLVRQ